MKIECSDIIISIISSSRYEASHEGTPNTGVEEESIIRVVEEVNFDNPLYRSPKICRSTLAAGNAGDITVIDIQ